MEEQSGVRLHRDPPLGAFGGIVKSPKTWGAVIGAVALSALASVALFAGPKIRSIGQFKAVSAVPGYGKALIIGGSGVLGAVFGYGLGAGLGTKSPAAPEFVVVSFEGCW